MRRASALLLTPKQMLFGVVSSWTACYISSVLVVSTVRCRRQVQRGCHPRVVAQEQPLDHDDPGA